MESPQWGVVWPPPPPPPPSGNTAPSGIASLSVDLLLRVLSFCGFPDRSAAACVDRRWRAALEGAPPALAAAARGGALASMAIQDFGALARSKLAAAGHLHRLVAPASPPALAYVASPAGLRLRQLRLLAWEPPGGAAAGAGQPPAARGARLALAGHTGLEALELGATALVAGAWVDWGSLPPALAGLALRCNDVPALGAALAAAVKQAAGTLTRLSVAGDLMLESLDCISALRGLTSLELTAAAAHNDYDGVVRAPLNPPPPSSLRPKNLGRRCPGCRLVRPPAALTRRAPRSPAALAGRRQRQRARLPDRPTRAGGGPPGAPRRIWQPAAPAAHPRRRPLGHGRAVRRQRAAAGASGLHVSPVRAAPPGAHPRALPRRPRLRPGPAGGVRPAGAAAPPL